jgi:hypothetical protein
VLLLPFRRTRVPTSFGPNPSPRLHAPIPRSIAQLGIARLLATLITPASASPGSVSRRPYRDAGLHCRIGATRRCLAALPHAGGVAIRFGFVNTQREASGAHGRDRQQGRSHQQDDSKTNRTENLEHFFLPHSRQCLMVSLGFHSHNTCEPIKQAGYISATSAMGHSRRKWAVHPMSAFPPIATIERTCEEVRLVPMPEVDRPIR